MQWASVLVPPHVPSELHQGLHLSPAPEARCEQTEPISKGYPGGVFEVALVLNLVCMYVRTYIRICV